MFNFLKKKPSDHNNKIWIKLEDLDGLTKIDELSILKSVAIFKHSTRCPISSMAMTRIEKHIKPGIIDIYLLDLIAFRDVSNAITEKYKIEHQSPQILLINKGMCFYNDSHTSITFERIVQTLDGFQNN